MEEYEPFRAAVSWFVGGRTRAIDFPFESWWSDGEDRIYIPLKTNSKKSEKKKTIEEFLQKFKGIPKKGLPAAESYEIVNYGGGLARPVGGKNSYKIMRIINASKEKELKELEDKRSVEGWSDAKYKSVVDGVSSVYDDLASDFQNDPSRAAKEDNLYAVISKNPHDLASMSTGRGWTSCMNLKSGSNKETVWCELKNGGFVAYMIRGSDREINNPLARILIRRFDRRNKKTGVVQSVAIPEDVIYGVDNPEFMATVNNWLRKKQGNVIGRFYRRGGEYSDTFTTSRKQAISSYVISNSNFKNIFKKYLNASDKFKKSKSGVILAGDLENAILNDKSLVFDTEAKNMIFGSMFPEYYPDLNYPKFELYGAVGLSPLPLYFMVMPDMFRKNLLKDYIDSNSSKTRDGSTKVGVLREDVIKNLNKLYAKYPEFFDDEDLKKFDINFRSTGIMLHKIDEMSPKALEEYRKKVINISEEVLDVSRYDQSYVDKMESYYDLHKDLFDLILNGLVILKPLPPAVVRKLIALWNNRSEFNKFLLNKNKVNEKFDIKLDSQYLKSMEPNTINSETKYPHDLASNMIHLFAMTKTDNPIVLNWLEEILSIKGFIENEYNKYGYYLASLGRDNGSRFLPFLNRKKEEVENKLASTESKYTRERYLQAIESINYIIDSIQTGSRSNKYNFIGGYI